MRLRILIVGAILSASGVALFGPRGRASVERVPLADLVPATSVIYIGIKDVTAPFPSLVERMLGASRLREAGDTLPPGLRSVALYATLENGSLQWRAVGRIHGLVVHHSWSDRPAPTGPSLASRREFMTLWSESRSSVLVWIDLEALALSLPGEKFRALALEADGSKAVGVALYSYGSYRDYIDKSGRYGRTGRFPEAAFAVGGSENFDRLARDLGLDERLAPSVVGPAWGCVLRGEALVVFVEAQDRSRARRLIEQMGSDRYRYVDGWCLWSNDPRALDGFVPGIEGTEHVALHFEPQAAAALERLAREHGHRIPVSLSALGVFDLFIRYRTGGARVDIRFE